MLHSPIKIIVTGASGRMGQALVQAIAARSDMVLAGVIEKDTPIAQMEALFAQAQAVIDFTSPSATVQYATLAAKHKLVHVIGTTGFSSADEAAIQQAAQHTAIIKSGNFSIGVNVLAAVTEQVARTLNPQYDIEIVEMHHKNKVDAPSGTALLLGHAAATGRSVNLQEHAIYERFGHTRARAEGTIGFATLRGGSVIGDHTVMFAGPQERIELTHKAEARSIFADGALHAAAWGVDKAAGLYSMRDVLGL